jgi:hypothetical protein
MVLAVSFFEILFEPLFILALPLRAATIPQAPTSVIAISHAASVRGWADLNAENIHPQMEASLTERNQQDADSTRVKKGFVPYQVRPRSSPDHRALY